MAPCCEILGRAPVVSALQGSPGDSSRESLQGGHCRTAMIDRQVDRAFISRIALGRRPFGEWRWLVRSRDEWPCTANDPAVGEERERDSLRGKLPEDDFLSISILSEQKKTRYCIPARLSMVRGVDVDCLQQRGSLVFGGETLHHQQSIDASI